jgi:hypothetical protein
MRPPSVNLLQHQQNQGLGPENFTAKPEREYSLRFKKAIKRDSFLFFKRLIVVWQ